MMLKRISSLLLTSSAAFVLMAGVSLDADAGTRSYSHIQNAQSSGDIRIQSPGEGATNRSIVLPYSKSSVVELPENVMDVIVSNPEIVEAVVHTSKRTVLIGKNAGQTNAFFYSHDGRELLNLDIRVEKDINGLIELIRKNTPNANVEVTAINDKILLTGSVPNSATADAVEKLARMWSYSAGSGGFFGSRSSGGEAEDIVNLMSIEGKDQVMLKVRIVEMQRSITKQLGFDLSVGARLGDATVSLVNNVTPDMDGGMTLGAAFTSAGGAIRSFAPRLQALERVGLIRTLAEPTLTAISGETANFLSGGELPILSGVSIDPQTGGLIREFEFKPYGVSLGFTPVVLSEGMISLNISTEVSEPTVENAFDTIGGDILGIRVRRANTVVELPAGGSLVIAGLIREEARNAVEGVPGMKDIPGLGALFRARDGSTVQTELVVIVTPYLVDPTHPDNLQTPLDGFVPESDGDNFLLGRINKVYAENGQPKISTETLDGPFGHVVD